MNELSSYFWLVPVVVVLLVGLFAYKLILRIFGIVIIPQETIGVVNKKFVVVGANRTLPDGAIIALNGEAGYQADTLAPGLHFGYWPWQYEIERWKFTTISEGQVGVVEACDGVPLSEGRVLGRHAGCNSFQDARAFLTGGGERGPQITIIPPGTYRLNPKLFTVISVNALEIPDGKVGIVTTKEGKELPRGEIAGRSVGGHNLFQDAQTFINSGGFKGLQEQVILAGRYYINPRFATVELVPMTEVPIAHVGVVIAYVGDAGIDVTGDSFKHGNLVSKGQKGVWVEPLDPGRYAINPHTHKVETVPTANVVLNWATGKTESHLLDKNLSTIKVRSADGFTFSLDVSQIIHIPRTDAPKVIARMGNVSNLVTQVLEPTIGNYFRNAAQDSDVIAFLKSRSQRQEEAKRSIQKALEEYNVGAVDTLIGDIVPPNELMQTLTDRKIADQQKVTFEVQRTAEETRKSLEQAKAIAATQAKVVDAERTVAIADFAAQASVKQAEGQAQAAIKTAEGSAQARKLAADGEATYLTTVGAAEASKVRAIGTAEAEVIKSKTEAMNQEQYASVEIARALAGSGRPLVPEIVAGGNGESGGMINLLLAKMLKDQNGTVDSHKK